MHPYVEYDNGLTRRYVKNLGWLLRHSQEVNHIEVQYNGLNDNEAYLFATGETRTCGYVHSGPCTTRKWTYRTSFASARIALDFVKMRRFAHATVTTPERWPSDVVLV